MQDAVALRGNHVQGFLRRPDPLVDDPGAFGIGDGIVRPMNDGRRAGDVRQAAFQFVRHLAKFDQAAHRQMACMAMLMPR
jgi:hypothetical protein